MLIQHPLSPCSRRYESIIDNRYDGLDGNDSTTQDLEAAITGLTGCEAALFLPSSTMGNYLTLRVLLHPLLSLLVCDARSRIAHNEISSVIGMHLQRLSPENQLYLTMEEIKEQILRDESKIQSVGDDSPWQRHVIACENTLAGVIMPLEGVQRISDFARRYGTRGGIYLAHHTPSESQNLRISSNSSHY